MRNSSDSTSAVVSILFTTLRGEKSEHAIVIPMLLIALRSSDRRELATLGHQGLLEHIYQLSKLAVKAGENSPTVDLTLPFDEALASIHAYCSFARTATVNELLSDIPGFDNESNQFGSILSPLLQQLSLHLTEHLPQLSPHSIDTLLQAIADIPEKYSPESNSFYHSALNTYLYQHSKTGVAQFPKEVCKFMLTCLEQAYDQPWDERNLLIPNLDNSLGLLPHVGSYTTIGYTHSDSSHWLTTLTTLGNESNSLEVYEKTGLFPSDMEDFNPFSDQGSGYDNLDHVIATPPFGVRLDREAKEARTQDLDTEWVLKIHEQLAYNGTAVIAVPPRFLHSHGTHYKFLRENLVEASMLDTVIMMPAGLLAGMSVPFAILVLKKDRDPRAGITMIDASEAFIQDGQHSRIFDPTKILLNGDGAPETHIVLTKKDLQSEGYIYSPGRYLMQVEDLELEEGHTLVQLSELVTLKAPKSVTPTNSYRLLSLKDITGCSGYTPFTPDCLEGEAKSHPELASQLRLLDYECILVSPIIRDGKVSAVWFKPGDTPVFTRPDVYILQFDPQKVNPQWLVLALHSERTSRQAQTLIRGSAIPRITRADLGKIRLSLPPALVQQRVIVDATKEAELNAKARELGLEQAIARNEERFWDDLRTKRHSIAPHINDLQSGIDTLLSVLLKAESLSADSIISKRRGLNTVQYLQSLQKKASTIGKFTDELTRRDILRPTEPLDLPAANREWKERHSSNGTTITLNESDAAIFLAELSEADDPDLPKVNLSKEDYFDALTLILNNAELHGFSSDQKSRELHITLTYTALAGHVTVRVSNNGKPLPKGMDTRRFTTRHAVAGETGNTGIGGHHLFSIVEHGGGSLEISSDESSPFPVSVTLTFPTI